MTSSWTGRPRKCGSIPGRLNRFLSWSPSCLLGTGVHSSEVKLPGLEVNLSPASSAEVKKECICTVVSLFAFIGFTRMLHAGAVIMCCLCLVWGKLLDVCCGQTAGNYVSVLYLLAHIYI